MKQRTSPSEAAHVPQDAAAAAGQAVSKAIENEANKIVEILKMKFLGQVRGREKQSRHTFTWTTAGMITVLMLPGFIDALFAICVVRLLDRRRARNQERKLRQALTVVKEQADKFHAKLAS